MRTLYINGKILRSRRTGLGRYLTGVVEGLVAKGLSPRILVPGGAPHPDYAALAFLCELVPTSLPLPLFEAFSLGRLARRHKGAILWSPANLGALWHPRQCLTVHDLACFHEREWMPALHRRYYRLLMPRVLRASKAYAFNSQTTATEVHSRFPDTRQVDSAIAPCGCSDFFSPGEAGRSHFALVVGSLEPRKNLSVVLNAWAAIPAELRQSWQLKVVGTRKPDASAPKLPPIDGVEFLGAVDDTSLRDLYRTAAFSIYPSKYEGFGLPLLESMRCGCPVLTAAAPYAFEVAPPPQALHADPDSVDAFALVIKQALCDPQGMAEMAARALVYSQRFSWETAIEAHVHLFKRMDAQ